MALQPSRIGSYVIERELGRGGMGVVYLAADTRLGRPAAIKSIADALQHDDVNLARFEREARTLASLNHPGIASVYSLEEHEGRRYLVMEYVEGRTLAQLIQTAPLPVTEATEICAQIAHALDAAHASGIVHRDLKPANVMVTPAGRAKVLDFGLARSGPVAVSTDTPTLTSPHAGQNPTLEGFVIGTPAYMSPEQARGRAVDKRADIWAFGCVLYECLTGRVLFKGDTVAESLAAVLERPIDLEALPAATPARIRDLLRRCLERDPQRRLRDIGDAAYELEETLQSSRSSFVSKAAPAPSTPAPAAAPVRAHPWWMSRVVIPLAMLGAGVASTLLFLRPHPQPPASAVTEFVIPLEPFGEPSDRAFGQRFDLSRDGSVIVALEGASPGKPGGLVVRRLDSRTPRILEGTEDASSPAISPDGRHVAFMRERGGLWRVPIEGGTPQRVYEQTGLSRGLVWHGDGYIYWNESTRPGGEVLRVRDSGGPVEIVAESGGAGTSLRWPIPVQGGVLAVPFLGQEYADLPINFYPANGSPPVTVVEKGYGPRLVGADVLLFGRDGLVFAARYDQARHALSGDPVQVIAGAWADAVVLGAVDVRVSDDGTLAYALAGPLESSDRLVRISREGEEIPMPAVRISGILGQLSPDGRQLYATISDPLRAVGVVDLERGVVTKLSPRGRHWFGGLSHDGRRVYFISSLSVPTIGGTALYTQRLDGAQMPELVGAGLLVNSYLSTKFVCETPDGKSIIVALSGTEARIAVVDVATGRPDPTKSWEGFMPQLSPDGRWVAYLLPGREGNDLYVRGYPALAQPMKLAESVRIAAWSDDGSELYLLGEQGLQVVAVDPPAHAGPIAGDPVAQTRFSTAKPLVPASKLAPYKMNGSFVPTPDAKGFYVIKREPAALGAPGIVVRTNWLEGVRIRLRAGK